MLTTPYEIVAVRHPLPYTSYAQQVERINKLAPLRRAAYYWKVGTGKTGAGTVHSLYQQITEMVDQTLVLVPPILQTAWMNWFAKIPGVTATRYSGSPVERPLIDLHNTKFVVLSYHIFKRDFDYYMESFRHRQPGVLWDEASALKNVQSQNYRMLSQFVQGFTYEDQMRQIGTFLDHRGDRALTMMTGTPTATPEDAYTFIKFIAPHVYRDKRIFDRLHIAKKDEQTGTVLVWQNLDLLQKNFEIGSTRLNRSELPGYVEPIYTPMPYKMNKEHLALYTKMCDEGVLELDNGGKIDATSFTRLWTYMQQIIMNWDHFSGDPKKKSAGYDLIDEIMFEMAAEKTKIIIVANYQMTMKGLMKHLARFNPKLINGTLSTTQQERAKQEFIEQEDSLPLLIQPRSGGYGLDGLQTVCNDMLVIEEPISPIDFEQTCGRIDRTGQLNHAQIRVAYAEDTIQVRLHNLLLKKDELSTQVQGGFKSLREALYGR